MAPDKPQDVVVDLDADSVEDALRLLVPQAPGFEWALKVGVWHVTVDGKAIAQAELGMRLPDRAFVSIRPALRGETGLEITALGWWLIGASVALGIYAASQIPSIPDTDHLEHGERRSLFSGPVNSAAQGGAVPLIYGRTRVGSVVASGGITQERPTGGDYVDPPTLGLGGDRPSGADIPRPERGRDAPRPTISTAAGDASEERSVMRVIDVLGEGEIEGLVDGLKSVYIDGVAVEDDDGMTNLEGVSIQERKGLPHGDPGQKALLGFDSTSTNLGAARTELAPNTPFVQNVPRGYDAVRVTLFFPRLLDVDDKGNEIAAEVAFTIESRPGSRGQWTTVLRQTMSDRSLDEQEASWRVERPESVDADGTWQVRVTRTSPAAATARLSNDVYVQRMAGLRDVKQTYPHTALVGITIETDRVEVNPLRRQYELRGRKVLTPPDSVWNPGAPTATHAAAYGAGLWDGSGMVRRWTDNPAWIALDILLDERSGLGSVPGMAAAARAARAEFLALSRRCDEFVPAPNSDTEMEPRWRFNGVIQKREQARRVVDWVLSACRAGVLWREGAVGLVIDGDSDVAASIGNANVIDGEFEYEGTRRTERYSAVAVTWQDPDDEYQSTIEQVIDHDLVARYGYRAKQVAAVGCTARGQAARVGWLVLNEQERESETCRFRMALEGMHLRPGDRVRIADEARYGVRAAFRVRSVDTSTPGQETIELDGDAPRLVAGGRIVWGESGAADVSRAEANRDDLLRTTDVPTNLRPGDLVVNAASAVDWIVTRLSERDQVEVQVHASRYDPNKYTAVEQRRSLSPPLLNPYAALLAPTAVTVRETTYEDRNLVRSQLEIAIRGGDDPRIDRVEYQIQRPKRRATPEEIAAGDWSVLPRGPWEPLRITGARSIIDRDVALGGYLVRARFIGRRTRSPWTVSAAGVADGKTDSIAAPAAVWAASRAGGYWVGWAAVAAADYAYTEIYDRPARGAPPLNPAADIDVEAGGWTFRGRIAGTGFLRVDAGTDVELRVAVRHVDTSGIATSGREVAVTTGDEITGADGEDGEGVEYIFAVTATQALPEAAAGVSAPSAGFRYDRPVAPYTDGLTGLSAVLPYGHRWRRPVPGSPARGAVIDVNWTYDGIVAHWGPGLPPPENVVGTATLRSRGTISSLGVTFDEVEGAAQYRLTATFQRGVGDNIRIGGSSHTAGQGSLATDAINVIFNPAVDLYGRVRWWTFSVASVDEEGNVGGESELQELEGAAAAAVDQRRAPVLTAVAGDSRIVVSWPTLPGVLSWQRRHKRTTSSSWGEWVAATSPWTFLGANDVSWDIQIRGIWSNGNGPAASVTRTPRSSTQPPPASNPPGAVRNLSATADGQNAIDVDWDAPNTGGTPTGYRIRRRVTGSGSSGWGTTGSTTSTAARFTGLVAGTSYDFQVWAVNGDGSGSARSTTEATEEAGSAPGIPGSLTGSLQQQSAGANARGNASWAAVAGATGYRLEHFVGFWTTAGSGYGDLGNVLQSAVSFATGSGVDLVGNNQAHRVQAYNEHGRSGWRQVDFAVTRG